jgi:lipopolysaccharide transport system ATP-binding protein
MAAIAVAAENLGKRYRIGVGRDPYGRLTEAIAGVFRSRIARARGRGSGADQWIWALRDVSFEIPEGEVVGFIGRNGAGKTTLLKILSRITEPTTGVARLRGRVGSLLEVGIGFHPELTGRENVLMSSAVFGMRRADIDRKFDEIIDFAGTEVEPFLDTPVKRYSSGMQLRLGFAVAAHLDPDILVVDEVLAVGDAAFQKKCLGKMSDVAHEGRTVILVSHNMTAVETLCNRAVWIDKGQVVEEGPSGEVVSKYLSTASTVEAERVWHDLASAPGNEHVRLTRATVRPAAGAPGDRIALDSPILLEFEYLNQRPNARLDLILEVYNQQRVFVVHTASWSEPIWSARPRPTGLYRTTCRIPGKLLNADTYSVTLRIIRDEGHPDVILPDTVVFEVAEDTDRDTYHKWLGAVRPDLEWTTDLVPNTEHMAIGSR